MLPPEEEFLALRDALRRRDGPITRAELDKLRKRWQAAPYARRPFWEFVVAEFVVVETAPEAEDELDVVAGDAGGAPRQTFEVKEAIRLWVTREHRRPPENLTTIAARTKLSAHAVRRVVRLVEAGALGWSEHLGAWQRTGPKGSLRQRTLRGEVALRTLEAAWGLAPLR